MIRVGFKSDVGKVREKNEDSCFVIHGESIFMVADGVGGENAGTTASSMAVMTIAGKIRKKPISAIEDSYAIREYLIEIIRAANKKIFNSAKANEFNRGMATTLVMAAIKKNIGYFANVGDSRAYIIRNGRLLQITEDHSYVNDLVKMGVITKDEAKNHEDSNMITRALGASDNVDVDVYKIELLDGDIVLLCSDGLYGELEDDEILSIVIGEDDMNYMAKRLVNKANENGGHDNISAICISYAV